MSTTSLIKPTFKIGDFVATINNRFVYLITRHYTEEQTISPFYWTIRIYACDGIYFKGENIICEKDIQPYVPEHISERTK